MSVYPIYFTIKCRAMKHPYKGAVAKLPVEEISHSPIAQSDNAESAEIFKLSINFRDFYQT